MYRLFKSDVDRILPRRRCTSFTRPGKEEAPSSSSRVMSAAVYSGGPSGSIRAGASGAAVPSARPSPPRADRAASSRGPSPFRARRAASGSSRPPRRSNHRYSSAASPFPAPISRSAARAVMDKMSPGSSSSAM